MLKKLIRFHSDDLWLYIGVEGGLFLLVEVIIGCVMLFVRPEDGVAVAWMMFPIVAGFVSLLTVSGHVAVTFDLALRFGQTRRRALGQFLGLSCFETAFGLALAALLSALEWFICPSLWAKLAGLDGWVFDKGMTIANIPAPVPGMDVEPGRYFVNKAGDLLPLPENTLLVSGFTLDWYWWLLIFALALAGGIIIGSLVQRFGQKGLWILWAFWMVLMFAPQLLRWEALTLPGWLNLPLLAGLFAAGLLSWSLWSMLHAVVRA